MSDSVVSALLLLRLFDDTEVSDSLDFAGGLLVSFLGYLAIDHVALGLCVLYSATLLYTPGVAHAQVGAIQVVLRHLGEVVEDCELVMLS